MNNLLIIASFAAGLIPILIFAVMYGFTTRWNDTPAGRFILAMAVTAVISYGLSFFTLLLPDVFSTNVAEIVRITVRFIMDAILWVLLLVFFWAQSSGRRKRRHKLVDKERESR